MYEGFLDFADEMNKPGVYIVSYWTPYRYRSHEDRRNCGTWIHINIGKREIILWKQYALFG